MRLPSELRKRLEARVTLEQAEEIMALRYALAAQHAPHAGFYLAHIALSRAIGNALYPPPPMHVDTADGKPAPVKRGRK